MGFGVGAVSALPCIGLLTPPRCPPPGASCRMRLSALLLALITDQPLSRDERWEIARLILQLLRCQAMPTSVT